jgi:hypothetical protein
MHDPDGGRPPDGTRVPISGAGGTSGAPAAVGAAPRARHDGAGRLSRVTREPGKETG